MKQTGPWDPQSEAFLPWLLLTTFSIAIATHTTFVAVAPHNIITATAVAIVTSSL